MDILLLLIYIIEIVLITISIFTVKKANETLDVNLKKKKIDVIDECINLNRDLIKKLTKILIITQSEELAENKIEQIKEVIQSTNKNNF